jgi:predicted lipoprotein with Yx(FWY)xxD motif
MNARKIALTVSAALAAVPLAACGSPADARPAVPRSAAQAMPAVQSRPAVADRLAAADRMAELGVPPRRGPIVRLGRAGGYWALVDGRGRALYLFTPDRGRGVSRCYNDCAREWPPLYGRAYAGRGVQVRHLGWTIREDGRAQVTYHGHPLYYYANDRRPGDARGQGLGGIWYLVDSRGNAIRSWRGPMR